ncbi:hypothetical protein [Pyrofollis japonicus]|uniref:hypothetical protein n=1 Tax=Pyrofollis japonicus TaxID=3060460 RepID=UPI00295AF0AD|nr:hypothetical protein [Pyrofollis japonicus]
MRPGIIVYPLSLYVSAFSGISMLPSDPVSRITPFSITTQPRSRTRFSEGSKRRPQRTRESVWLDRIINHQ